MMRGECPTSCTYSTPPETKVNHSSSCQSVFCLALPDTLPTSLKKSLCALLYKGKDALLLSTSIGFVLEVKYFGPGSAPLSVFSYEYLEPLSSTSTCAVVSTISCVAHAPSNPKQTSLFIVILTQ